MHIQLLQKVFVPRYIINSSPDNCNNIGRILMQHSNTNTKVINQTIYAHIADNL